MGGMGDDDMSSGMGDDDMSDDMGDMDSPPSSQLPEGVKKEILNEASADSWKKPRAGDEVTVHYVGWTEENYAKKDEPGTEFDGSRGRGMPFVFTLGRGQVIKGWDLGVA